jgi:DNA-binding CsgD family transcriptional regulator
MYAAYMDGAFAEALRRIDGALGAIRRTDGRRAREIDILRAEALLATDEFEAAQLAAGQASTDAKRDHQGSLETAWRRFIGRHHLQSGLLAEANGFFDDLFASEVIESFENVGLAAAMVASGRVAIHLGDARRAKNVARIATNTLSSGSPELRRHASWFLVLHAMSCRDDASLQVHLETLRDEAIAPGFPLLMVDVADLPQLVRIALDAGADDVAGSVAEAARQRHRANPDVRSIAGIAAHASGLIDRDHAALEGATALLAGGPRPLAAAAAYEDLGVDAVLRGNRASGLDALGNALQLYSTAGATWDESRVRLRLRELGVRRRLVKAARPTNGWKALTDAEVAVVRLVAEGLTNRAIAERLYVSPHTVSMHLRHVFTKLGIRSRVELTRMAFEGDQAA